MLYAYFLIVYMLNTFSLSLAQASHFYKLIYLSISLNVTFLDFLYFKTVFSVLPRFSAVFKIDTDVITMDTTWIRMNVTAK